MADGTKIEWTDATWNVINGCTVHSPGCANCYAMRLAATRMRHHASREGLARWHNGHAQWTGEVRFDEKVLTLPLRWRRQRRIFVCAHGDLFHEKVPDEWVDRVFAVMALAPRHQFQVLTKRADRMRDYVSRWYARRFVDGPRGGEVMVGTTDAMLLASPPLDANELLLTGHPLQKNIWLGVSVEDQERADERIPLLLDTPAAVRWLSCEPLLGPVDLRLHGGWCRACRQVTAGSIEGHCFDPASPCFAGEVAIQDWLNWVVAGGESGPGARPMHPDWARSLRDQCANAGVPFLFKQWGEFAPGEIAGDFLNPEKPAKGISLFDGQWDECWSEVDGHCDDEPDLYRVGKRKAGRTLDGQLHDGFPA